MASLTEEFKRAYESSNTSGLEMSWSLGVTQERFKELLDGAQYSEKEELLMMRFVFKSKNKASQEEKFKQQTDELIH